MVRVCLVAAPTVSELEDGPIAQSTDLRDMALDVPLGILSLAAVLEQHGFLPDVVDLNRFFLEYSWPEQGSYRHLDFCSFAAARLAEHQFDVIGFSTMCSSFPLTLRLAQEIRRTHPGATIVLGGPQASVVDEATLAAFAAVDVIVRGEAEVTFPRLLEALADGDDLSRIQGITYRHQGKIVRNPNAPVIEDLDSLPLPAYHLLARDRSLCFRLALEVGRGCPFACTFCSTNDFFRRRFRLKSPARLIEQMSFLHQTYGTESFDLIHDMFTVDRKESSISAKRCCSRGTNSNGVAVPARIALTVTCWRSCPRLGAMQFFSASRPVPLACRRSFKKASIWKRLPG